MPVIVNSEEIHPFLPSLGSPEAIERDRAERQDIRTLEFAVINIMADKQATERQLARCLGNSPLQVKLTFAAPDGYVRDIRAGRESRNTPSEHIRKFYCAWNEIKDQKFDGLVVTGVNALKDRVEDEDIWPDMQNILAWSQTNVLSSLFLCWGAQAALKHFHDIDSLRGERKLFGLFEHHLGHDRAGLLAGFPDIFPIPVSRWKSPTREAIQQRQMLEIIGDSPETGPNIIAETAPYGSGRACYPKRIYILNHPEYDTDTLKQEYARDHSKDPNWPLPHHYFPGDDPTREPLNRWRHTAQIYTNWVHAVYEATPYELANIPNPLAK
ncbi:MAG: homoserine O-succinyltransferase [Bdellovibrionales bacterium]